MINSEEKSIKPWGKIRKQLQKGFFPTEFAVQILF